MKRDIVSQPRHPNHTLTRNSMSISAAVSVADCLGFDLDVGVAVGVVAVDLAVGLVRCHASPKLLGHRERVFASSASFFAIVARALGSVASRCMCRLALILLNKKAFSSKTVMCGS
jgi:hypothetical protein